ncbi:MAG: hypothetical protein ACRD2B_09555 [Terriglobia bacterium]
MKILALVITLYTLPMLLIHFSTPRILNAWNGNASSWIKRQFSPRRALRIEAIYWLLSLAAWPLWRAVAWKTLVVVFATIHLGVWLSGEFGKVQLESDSKHNPAHARKLDRAIITFDLIEAVVLVAVGTLAALYLLHAGGWFHPTAN